MRIVVVTLFPEFVEHAVRFGVLGRAIERGVLAVETANPRRFRDGRAQTVDDRPYGGGPGMVLKAEPLRLAMRVRRGGAAGGASRVSGGRRRAADAARRSPSSRGCRALVLLAGRYEGVDERFVERRRSTNRVSVGDCVLTGGELPALVVIDAVARLLPGTLGDAESAVQESFADGLLDWPHYTRPEVLEGRAVPPVLIGGNHAAIARWRLKQALGRTWQRRPELLERRGLECRGAQAPRRISGGAGSDAPRVTGTEP